MSLEKMKLVSEQILARTPSVKGRGEEATKQALILPMLDALGFDIWNPAEVCPEYDADFAVKKLGQKENVDLCISFNGILKIFFEVKAIDSSLDGHEGQLARYFNAKTSVALGVLTNGLEWRFFTDTGDVNVMDNHPFHVVRLEAADQGLEVMARFAKSVFSAEAIRDYATELKYTANIANFLREELDLKDRDPSENMIRWILKSDSKAGKLYDGIVNGNVVDRFRPIAKAAITRVIREIVRRSITAMEEEAAYTQTVQGSIPDSVEIRAEVDDSAELGRGIVTTERELRAFEIAKAIFDESEFASATIFDATPRKDVPIEFSYKDTTGYFGVYLNKPAWWVARIVTEAKKPWIGFSLDKDSLSHVLPEGFTMLESGAFAESRIAISGPEDLLRLKPVFLATIKKMVDDRKVGA